MEKMPPGFLTEKYPDMAGSKPVERAVGRARRKGEKVAENKEARTDAYVDRLAQLVLDPENVQRKKDMGDVLHTQRPRALALLREKIIEEYIRPNKDKMAEGAAMVEERAARQMGIEAEYTEEQREERGTIAVGDLESSLDQWVTYLSDKNEPYPAEFRYYVFRNILNLGEYDKDKKEFPQRSKGTFKLFPDIDRGALAYIEERIKASADDSVLKRIQDAQRKLWHTPEDQLLTKEQAKAFAQRSFGKQYAEGIAQNGELTDELRAETKGVWKTYQQGTDPTALWLSLQNKGTAWCTKGFPTAQTQLQGGDFHVYYTFDAQGEPTIPRIAIRMQGTAIGENPRGVFDSQQNLEPNMVEILEEKLKEFGSEADAFKKKSGDMKLLTELENKIQKSENLTKEDLTFLYEIDANIEGFGYQKDPRVEELREGREVEVDMLTIFDCAPEDIVHSVGEITEHTKAYVGALEPGIFQKLPETLEHVYTTFPNERIRFRNIELGRARSGQEYSELLNQKGIQVSGYAQDMLLSKDFAVLKEGTHADLVEVSVKALGFPTSARYDQICAQAQELGLELAPAEAGPAMRLQDATEEWLLLGMKSISDRDGYPGLLLLYRRDDGLWLGYDGGGPGDVWGSDVRFVFSRPRKTL